MNSPSFAGLNSTDATSFVRLAIQTVAGQPLNFSPRFEGHGDHTRIKATLEGGRRENLPGAVASDLGTRITGKRESSKVEESSPEARYPDPS